MNKEEKELQIQLAKEERELQIKLAEEERKLTILLAKLNIEIQIELALIIGLGALSLTSFIAGYQFFQNTQDLLYSGLASFLILFGIVFMFLAVLAQQKHKKTRKKIWELK